MDWVKWAIPLVVVAVIILSNLGKAIQDRQKRTQRNPPPPRPDDGSEPPPARPRGTAANVERYLEGINRRRFEAERRKRETSQPRETPPPVRSARPAPPPLPPVPVLAPPLVAPVRLVGQERPAPPLPQRRASEREAVAKAPPPPTPAPAPEAAPAHQAPAGPLVASAIAPGLRDLLKNPQSLRVAIMLREVLDPPLSRRGKRQGGGGPV